MLSPCRHLAKGCNATAHASSASVHCFLAWALQGHVVPLRAGYHCKHGSRANARTLVASPSSFMRSAGTRAQVRGAAGRPRCTATTLRPWPSGRVGAKPETVAARSSSAAAARGTVVASTARISDTIPGGRFVTKPFLVAVFAPANRCS